MVELLPKPITFFTPSLHTLTLTSYRHLFTRLLSGTNHTICLGGQGNSRERTLCSSCGRGEAGVVSGGRLLKICLFSFLQAFNPLLFLADYMDGLTRKHFTQFLYCPLYLGESHAGAHMKHDDPFAASRFKHSTSSWAPSFTKIR